MFVRIRSASWSRWGQASLAMAMAAVPVFTNCTKSEDTEPFVPSMQGATQPGAEGALISEDDACSRLLSAARDAYDRLRCEAPSFPECPAFVRPGGGNGCYEYSEGSVEACEQAYEDAASCSALSPCFATAVSNPELSTCERPEDGEGGSGGAGGSGGGGADSRGGAGGSGGGDTANGGALSEGGASGSSGQASGGDASGGTDG